MRRALATNVSCMLCPDPDAKGVALAASDTSGLSAWLFQVCDGCIDEIIGARAEARKIDARVAGARPNNYGPDWPGIRARILERDGGKCQDDEHKRAGGSGPDDNIVVHHIKPLRTFGGDFVSANHESNLITLCKQCHGRWHAELDRQTKTAAQQ